MTVGGAKALNNDPNAYTTLTSLMDSFSASGVFCRQWIDVRMNVNNYVGFRAAAYGS